MGLTDEARAAYEAATSSRRVQQEAEEAEVRKRARARVLEVLDVDVMLARWELLGNNSAPVARRMCRCVVDGLELVYEDATEHIAVRRRTDLELLTFTSKEDLGRLLSVNPWQLTSEAPPEQPEPAVENL